MKKMSGHEAKVTYNNEKDCDNPISLDEIEKGLWLGTGNINELQHFLFIFQYIVFVFFQEVSLLQLI